MQEHKLDFTNIKKEYIKYSQQVYVKNRESRWNWGIPVKTQTIITDSKRNRKI